MRSTSSGIVLHACLSSDISEKEDSQGADQGRHVRQESHHGIVSPKMTTPPVKMIIVCTRAFPVLLTHQQVHSSTRLKQSAQSVVKRTKKAVAQLSCVMLHLYVANDIVTEAGGCTDDEEGAEANHEAQYGRCQDGSSSSRGHVVSQQRALVPCCRPQPCAGGNHKSNSVPDTHY